MPMDLQDPRESLPHRASLGFVFAIVLVDMLGFGIVIPVLPRLIMGLAHVPLETAAVYAGWLGAGYAAMQFLFAPIIGNLSDRFGRRPVMLASVLAMAIDYSIQGYAPAFWWLIIGRIVAGITGASFSAAYAWIADVTPPERRAQTFGLMGMAFGFGFIVGPAAGGFLATISDRAPFHAAALLAFANFLFGLAFLRESLAPENRRRFDIRQANAFGALKALRGQNGAVIWFVAALAMWQLAHVVYPAIWSYFAMEAYHFDQREVGFGLAMVGLTSALVQGLGLRLVAPRLGERRAVMLGIGAVCISALLYHLAHGWALVALAITVGSLQGFIQPSIAAMNSRAVGPQRQGELQGATQAVNGLAQIVGPPLYAGVFARFTGPSAIAYAPAMPLIVSATVALAALALFLAGARRLGQSTGIG